MAMKMVSAPGGEDGHFMNAAPLMPAVVKICQIKAKTGKLKQPLRATRGYDAGIKVKMHRVSALTHTRTHPPITYSDALD